VKIIAHLGFLAHREGDPAGMESQWLSPILLTVACTGNTLHNSPLLVYTFSYTSSILSTIIQKNLPWNEVRYEQWVRVWSL